MSVPSGAVAAAGSARPLTRPRRLRRGDRVAVVAPSGPVDKARLEAGCAVLRGWGLRVEVAPHVLDRHDSLGYLAGADADRARDLQDAWLDPGVAAVFLARGGYGVPRLVDRLDWAAMRSGAPKIFAGFSDATALHEAIATQLGIATLYSPMIATQVFIEDGPAAQMLRQTLFEPQTTRTLTSSTAAALAPGAAHGVIVGGCACLLAAGIATPFARAGVQGGILILEDVDEEPYRLDRILTQLVRSGWLDGVAGIVTGSWKDCGAPEQIVDVILDRLGGYGVPILHELGFGHCDSPMTIPLGVHARLDADTATLTLDRPALA